MFNKEKKDQPQFLPTAKAVGFLAVVIMKFGIIRASNKPLKDYPGITYNPDGGVFERYTIEINDLSDLEKLENDFGSPLVVSIKHHSITIYDGYIE